MIADRELGRGDAAYDYSSRKWGGIQTRPVITAGAAYGATPTRILTNNPRRMEWTLFNVGNAVVYLWFDSSVQVNNGILIPAVGGSVGLMVDEDGEMVTYEVWVQSPAGTTVASVEVIQV